MGYEKRTHVNFVIVQENLVALVNGAFCDQTDARTARSSKPYGEREVQDDNGTFHSVPSAPDLQLPVRHDHGMKAGTCTSASSRMYLEGGHSNVVSLFFFLLIKRTLYASSVAEDAVRRAREFERSTKASDEGANMPMMMANATVLQAAMADVRCEIFCTF